MSYCAKHDTYYANTPECPRCATPDGIDALEAQVERLTAENARLRAEVEVSDLACRVAQHELAAVCRERDALRLDLARLTEDAAKRCSDLRADNARLVEELTAEGVRYEQWKREAERLRAEVECVRSDDPTWFSYVDRLTDTIAGLRAEAAQACPCRHTTPCQPDCTCARRRCRRRAW